MKFYLKNRDTTFQKLNIKYSDFWLKKCPPNGNVSGHELATDYLCISELDKEVYKKSNKEWYQEIRGFAISNGYIIAMGGGHYPTHYELTEKGILTKFLGGHQRYIEYVKMKSNSYKSQRNILLFTAGISVLTLIGTLYGIWKEKPIISSPIINVPPSTVLIQQIPQKSDSLQLSLPQKRQKPNH